MQQLDGVWEGVLGIIKLKLNAPTFKTWFSNTKPIELKDNQLTISAPNTFAKEWLESRYAKLICECLFEIVGKEINISFTTNDFMINNGGLPSVSVAPEKKQKNITQVKTGPHSKYTFDNFVIGSSNRFAHAAALAVSEKPSKAYNPLFIYGGVGLGKTHLLQAINNYISHNNKHLKVKYVSSEKFTNDFINSIRDKNKIVGFQKRYRNNDLLLIDDIQFLEKKEATQEEFFHTFNTLYDADKQIVISSDRPPKDISTLEERLRTRFESGLIVDIQPPDIETRIAILRKQVRAKELNVADDILELIATKIQSNIRELEGALTRIVAYSSLTHTEISIDMANSMLKDIFPDRVVRQVTIDLIIKEICRYYKISQTEIISKKRTQNIVLPRQIGMYLSRELTDSSLPKIGSKFGNRDHTTVIHAIAKIEKLLNERRDVFNQIKELTNKIK